LGDGKRRECASHQTSIIPAQLVLFRTLAAAAVEVVQRLRACGAYRRHLHPLEQRQVGFDSAATLAISWRVVGPVNGAPAVLRGQFRFTGITMTRACYPSRPAYLPSAIVAVTNRAAQDADARTRVSLGAHEHCTAQLIRTLFPRVCASYSCWVGALSLVRRPALDRIVSRSKQLSKPNLPDNTPPVSLQPAAP
jgi:hypothetical protein